MNKLNAAPARPRKVQATPSYPRCLAALAVVATMTLGCEKPGGEAAPAYDAGASGKTSATTPGPAMAGDMAPAFDGGTSGKTVTPAPTKSHPIPEVIEEGKTPAPFVSGHPPE